MDLRAADRCEARDPDGIPKGLASHPEPRSKSTRPPGRSRARRRLRGEGSLRRRRAGISLILRDLAATAVSTGTADEIELFFVGKDPTNHAELCTALSDGPVGDQTAAARLSSVCRSGNRDPERAQEASSPIFLVYRSLRLRRYPTVHGARNPGPASLRSFHHLYGPGCESIPESPNHRVAIAELVGLDGESLDRATGWVLESSRRVQALKDLYQQQLVETGGARYVWTFRVASSGAEDTVYYLIHGSNHIKAFREMKDATHQVGGWRSAFLGADDFAVTGQLALPDFATDRATLKQQILNVFAGREFAYDPPSGSSEPNFLNEAYPDPRFHMWVEKDFHAALIELIQEGKARKTPVDTKAARGLRGRDRIQFRAIKQLTF